MENMLKEILTKLTSLEEGQKAMQGDINTMKSDINTMQGDIKDLKADNLEVKEELKIINKKLNGIIEQTHDLVEFKTEISNKVENIAKDAGFIKHKLNRTEEDVFIIQNHLKIIK